MKGNESMRIDMPQCGLDMCRKYSDGNCHAVGGQREGCEFRTLEEKHKSKKPIENFYDERGEEFYDEGYVYSCSNCESEVGSFSTTEGEWTYKQNYCPDCGQKINWA